MTKRRRFTPEFKAETVLEVSAVKVPKQNCVGDITSAMSNFQSGNANFLKMRRPSLNPCVFYTLVASLELYLY